MREEEVLYVGQSTNVYARLATHLATKKRARPRRAAYPAGIASTVAIPFTSVMVRWCARLELDDLELKYIAQFNPKYNVKCRKPLPRMKISLEDLAAAAGFDWDKVVPKPELTAPRRRLVAEWERAEAQFKADRDKRMVVTMPKLRFMEEA